MGDQSCCHRSIGVGLERRVLTDNIEQAQHYLFLNAGSRMKMMVSTGMVIMYPCHFVYYL